MFLHQDTRMMTIFSRSYKNQQATRKQVVGWLLNNTNENVASLQGIEGWKLTAAGLVVHYVVLTLLVFVKTTQACRSNFLRSPQSTVILVEPIALSAFFESVIWERLLLYVHIKCKHCNRGNIHGLQEQSHSGAKSLRRRRNGTSFLFGWATTSSKIRCVPDAESHI